jgi:glyoxylase-like metal-dependent hydrolase (beta-lactamase superfamily II)
MVTRRNQACVQRIQLGNTVFEGQNNVYVLSGEPTTLVDTGIAVPDVEADLRDGLAEFGLTFADVEQILLSHWHYDHSGLAGTIQEAGEATVRVHTADAPLVSGNEPSIHAERERRERLFDEWGLPGDKREELQRYLDRDNLLAGRPAEVTPFEHGDVIRAGGRDLEVVHLPGHAAGLCGFAFDAGAEGADEGSEREAGREDSHDTELFSGDAVLPKYTPNVGGADVRVEDPLATYADSLVRFAKREFDRAWPGHRDRIDDPTGRALTILEHHRERTRNVVDVLADHGPADAWTVSAHLFGELAEIHILHGPGEAYAHLNHLDNAGVVDRDGDEYRLVDPDPDVDALFPRVKE